MKAKDKMVSQQTFSALAITGERANRSLHALKRYMQALNRVTRNFEDSRR